MATYLIKSLDPYATRKLKSPAVFTPTQSKISPDIINDFVKHHELFIDLIKRSDKTEHVKTIITSPAAKFTTYNLKDTFIILAIHEQRHFNQAERVLSMENFPK